MVWMASGWTALPADWVKQWVSYSAAPSPMLILSPACISANLDLSTT